MNLPRWSSRHGPVVAALLILLVGWGTTNFLTMSRRENPAILIRNCIVMTRWPGAPTEKVEELVTDPLEKAIAEIAEVDKVISSSRVGFSLINVELDERVKQVDQLWDEVRAKVAGVRLPEGCGAVAVNSDFGDVYDVCLAIYQTPPPGGWTADNERYRYTPRQLERFAETIEDELKLVPEVSKVDFWGVPEERIYVYVDSADWSKIDLTASQLADVMAARNIVAPGGEVDSPTGSYSVKPTGEFADPAEISEVVIGRLDDRIPVRLGELPITVQRGYQDPLQTMVRYVDPETPSTRALVVGASMKDGRNVVEMGHNIAARIAGLRSEVLPPDLAIRRVNDLPRQVDTVVKDFAMNLGQSIAIVLLLAFLLVGIRAGLVMATAVPLSMITAFAVVPIFGVELEQFSIASLIISLGLVVDNATVVTENTMRLMEEGMAKKDAAIRGARSLMLPMLAATATTVAAFLPMLTIIGPSGEYIRSLPIVVASTLLASYFVAMIVTPLMCYLIFDADKLRAKHLAAQKRAPAGPRRFDRVVAWCVAHRAVTLSVAATAFVGAMALSGVIGSQFFPLGERDQFFMKVWLPEGAPFLENERLMRRVEEAVLRASPDEDGEERLKNMVSFVGTGGPRIMLTQIVEQKYPYFSHVIVTTTGPKVTLDYIEDVKRELANVPDARLEIFGYALGPPLERPVEFRLSGEDSDVLREATEKMLDVMRATPGADSPSANWGASSYQLEVKIDADAANLAGLTNADVALTMNSLISGATLTTYREGDHLVPVVLRTRVGAGRDPLSSLAGIFVSGRAGKVPLDSVASVTTTWQPAIIARRNNVRTVTVGCRVDEGLLPNTIANRMRPGLEDIVSSLGPGYRLEEGGEPEKTAESQRKIGRAVMIAIFLIIFVLIVQYNSFLKPLVILLTVPMAMIGVMVGLFVTGWAMGFMAMLGVLSLAGIVINDAIVLIDFLEEKLRAGLPLREAAVTASRARLKPIVLTSLTTIGGLLPLALFGGPLWTAMAYGMIFGLMFSTALTLIIIPTLYVLFAERLRMKTARVAE